MWDRVGPWSISGPLRGLPKRMCACKNQNTRMVADVVYHHKGEVPGIVNLLAWGAWAFVRGCAFHGSR